MGSRSAVREVVVVDDASRDATASVACAAGATVLPAGDPPAGWTGKAWACHVGAEATSGDLLLFLDADTRFAPDALDGLLEVHDEYGGLVSVQPFHTVGAALRAAVVVLQRGRESSPAASSAATPEADRWPSGRACSPPGWTTSVRVATPPYVRRSWTTSSSRSPTSEPDSRCGATSGGRSVRMRSYPGGIRQLVAGWTKNFASGASAAAPGPTLGAVAWVSAHHAVAVGAVLALAGALAGHELAPTYGALCAVGGRVGGGRLAAEVGAASARLVPLVDLGPLPGAAARVRRHLRALARQHRPPSLGAVARSRGAARRQRPRRRSGA